MPRTSRLAVSTGAEHSLISSQLHRVRTIDPVCDLRKAAGRESRILDLRGSVNGTVWDDSMDRTSSEIIGWASSLISEFGSD